PPGCLPAMSRSPARRRRYGHRPCRRRLPGPRDGGRWSRRTSCVFTRANQVFLIVTLSMMNFSFGTPPPSVDGYWHEKPPFATFWTIFSPEETVANGV